MCVIFRSFPHKEPLPESVYYSDYSSIGTRDHQHTHDRKEEAYQAPKAHMKLRTETFAKPFFIALEAWPSNVNQAN